MTEQLFSGDNGADYNNQFAQLVNEMREINIMRDRHPGTFRHAATLLTTEITRIWNIIYKHDGDDMDDSQHNGDVYRLEEKIEIPVFPDGRDDQGRKCNLVGRILGPSGMSIRQLEVETGCEIVIRGNGSIKDVEKQEKLRGSPGYEHLDEPLYVRITAQDITRHNCEMKVRFAKKIINRLLQPGNDEYKKRQLINLAILRGTYRPENTHFFSPSTSVVNKEAYEEF